MEYGYSKYFSAVKKTQKGPKLKTGEIKVEQRNPSKKKPVQKKKTESVENLLRKELIKRRKGRRLNTPWLSLFIIGLCIGGVGIYIIFPKEIHGFISRVDIGWVTPADAEGAKNAENKSTPNGKNKEKAASTETTPKNEKGTSAKYWTEKELSHFDKLNERKDQLDLREKELNELEEELHRQKEEVEARIRKLEDIRKKIGKVLKDRVEIDEAKVEKLVAVYSSMKPKQAAEILGNINEDLAVEVLGRMKKKSAAAILNLLKPEKAQMLSEKYTGYKRR